MGMTVSGLGSSGLDVDTLVTQLMAAERQPQDQLSTKKTSVLSQQTAWGSISTEMTKLQDAINAVKTPTAFNSSTVTASDASALSATADGTATVASVTLQVQSLAAAQQQAS